MFLFLFILRDESALYLIGFYSAEWLHQRGASLGYTLGMFFHLRESQ